MWINKPDYLTAKSSFLNIEKDLANVVSRIAASDPILNLLVMKDVTNVLTSAERQKIVRNNIKVVPKIHNLNTSAESYIVITFNNFITNMSSEEYRDKTLTFDIICNFDTWNMGDFKLRPYSIAGYLDSIFNHTSLDGTFKINFVNANNLLIDDSIAGVTLNYAVIYGTGEDLLDD